MIVLEWTNNTLKMVSTNIIKLTTDQFLCHVGSGTIYLGEDKKLHLSTLYTLRKMPIFKSILLIFLPSNIYTYIAQEA